MLVGRLVCLAQHRFRTRRAKRRSGRFFALAGILLGEHLRVRRLSAKAEFLAAPSAHRAPPQFCLGGRAQIAGCREWIRV